MESKVHKNYAAGLREEIREILFSGSEPEGKIMCAVYPSRGLYLADGLGRYVLAQEAFYVDVADYLSEMKMRDFFILKAAFALKNEAQSTRGGN